MTVLRSSTITVNLLTDATLSSATEAQLLSDPGLNLFALGDPEGGWYVGKFATVSAQPAPAAPYVASYELTDILWGVAGTEVPDVGTDLSGLEFILLDSAIKPRQLATDDVGRELTFRCPTSGQSVDDAEDVMLTVRGESAKPLAPARVETADDSALAPRTADGAVLVSPWPRTNLAEIGEAYRVDYLEDDGSEIDGAFEVFKEGTPQAAMLVSEVDAIWATDEFAGIIAGVRGNSFELSDGTGTLGTGNATSIQKIRQPDNFAEANLVALNATVIFGLHPAGEDWRTVTPYHRFVLAADNIGNGTLTLYEGSTVLYTEDASDYNTPGKRFRFRLLGNKVQYFKDYVDESTPPLAESIVTPNYPLLVICYVGAVAAGAGGACEYVTLTTNPLPATVLTAAQQTLWYGGLKNPVRVKIRQHSGIREVGYGFAWEGEI